MGTDSHIGYGVKKSQNLNVSEKALCGSASGVIYRAIIQPLDVLKIRFQLQVEPTYGHDTGLYRGVWQAAKTIVTKEGVTALWKGHVPAQFLTVAYGAGQFGTYAVLTKYASVHGFGEGGTTQAVSGGIAGMVGTLVSMPFDVARTRLVAQSLSQYRGIIDAWRQMLRRQGFFSLWQGLLPTLSMTIPASAIHFRLYHLLLPIFASFSSKAPEKGLLSGLSGNAISGAIAGAVAKFVTYPFDVLKKRLQIRGSEDIRRNFGRVIPYKNMRHCIVMITKEEGLLAWYKGIWPSLIKGALSTGIIFAAFEFVARIVVMTHRFRKDED